METPRRCYIYANCQGNLGIVQILPSVIGDEYTFDNTTRFTYELIRDNLPLDVEALKKADLFIYQPVGDVHGQYSTNHIIKNILKPTCQTISFPYLYNPAVFSTYGGKMDYVKSNGKSFDPCERIELLKDKSFSHGFGHIYDLILEGKSLEDVITIFRNGEMNFYFDERWELFINNLKDRETVCDVKVAPYLSNMKSESLCFLDAKHPVTHVYVHIVNQILAKLGSPKSINEALSQWKAGRTLPHSTIKTCHSPGNRMNEWLRYINTHEKTLQALDQYSRSYWQAKGHTDSELDFHLTDDKYTEGELVDYYLKYKSAILSKNNESPL